jgi:signal transduction histidine kinase
VLNFVSKAAREFLPGDVELMRSIADLIGIAVERANIFSELRQKTIELEKANKDLTRREEIQKLLKELSQDITLLNTDALVKKLTGKVREFFRVDICDVRVMEKGVWRPMGISGIDSHRLQSTSTGTARGRSRWIIENRKTLAIPDAIKAPDIRSGESTRRLGIRGYLGVPLLLRSGEVIGVLRALNFEPREFSQEEVDLIQQLANGAGIAVENASLFSEVSQKRVELEKANKVKGEFLGFVSHELKTPVSTVMGYTEMLEEGVFGEITPEQRKILEKIKTYCRDLVSMIDSLLQATRIEAGLVKVEKEEIALVHFLDELKLVYSIPLGKKVTLVWNYPSEFPAIKTDRGKLRHILQNLISNAIKYTDKGNVTISVRVKEGKSIEFTVVDTGIGIPEELLPVIFEMFRQVERSKNGSRGGVGLGLHIVKKFTELLGGTVEVESELDQGSTFTVTIPYES